MESCINCVIGQVFDAPESDSGFDDATGSIGLVTARDVADCGFDIYPLDSLNRGMGFVEHHTELRTAWLAEIARRIEAKASPAEATS